MPSYVSTRLLAAREFAIGELPFIRESDPVYKAAILVDVRKLVPFEHFYIGGLDLEGCMIGCGIMLLTDLPEGLRESYSSEQMYEIDPLMTQLSPGSPDVYWPDLPVDLRETPAARRISNLFTQYQVGPRLVFSKWNAENECYGTASFMRQEPFTDTEINILKWLGLKLHSELSKPLLQAFNRQLKITDGEIRCLQWASQGLTSDEIAIQTGYSKETINSYFKSVAKKLGADNRTQAIADALRIGLID